MRVPNSYYLNRGYGSKNSRNHKTTTTIESIASTLADLITPSAEETTGSNMPDITFGEQMNMTMNKEMNMDTMTNFASSGIEMTNSNMNDFNINATMFDENSNSGGNIITEMATQASDFFTQIANTVKTTFNNETMTDDEKMINGTYNHDHMHHVQDDSMNSNSILYITLGIMLGVLVIVGVVIVVMYTQSKKRGFQEIAGANKDSCEPEPQSMTQIEQQMEKDCFEDTPIHRK